MRPAPTVGGPGGWQRASGARAEAGAAPVPVWLLLGRKEVTALEPLSWILAGPLGPRSSAADRRYTPWAGRPQSLPWASEVGQAWSWLGLLLLWLQGPSGWAGTATGLCGGWGPGRPPSPPSPGRSWVWCLPHHPPPTAFEEGVPGAPPPLPDPQPWQRWPGSTGRELEGAGERVNGEAAALAGGPWAIPGGGGQDCPGGRAGLAVGREGALGSFPGQKPWPWCSRREGGQAGGQAGVCWAVPCGLCWWEAGGGCLALGRCPGHPCDAESPPAGTTAGGSRQSKVIPRPQGRPDTCQESLSVPGSR